jgi:hypothetical protein
MGAYDLAYDLSVVSTFAMRDFAVINFLGVGKFPDLRRLLYRSNLLRTAPWLALAAYENWESERRVEIGSTSSKEQRAHEHGS